MLILENIVSITIFVLLFLGIRKLFGIIINSPFFEKIRIPLNQNGITVASSKTTLKNGSVFGEYSQNLYKKDYLMTKREAYFYRALSGYLQDKDYIICPKVRVEDIIGIRSNFGFRPWKASGRLDRSHVDFLLIGKTDLKTKFVIEVDDHTHDSFLGKERDKIKDEACQITGIPLIRFRDIEKIKEVFMGYGVQ